LQRDRFGDQLRVQFRPVDFLDVDVTSRFVRFWISPLSLSISAPLRPMMIPGRAVNRRITSLLAARSISIELIPAERSLSFNCLRRATSSCSRSA